MGFINIRTVDGARYNGQLVEEKDTEFIVRKVSRLEPKFDGSLIMEDVHFLKSKIIYYYLEQE